MTKTAHPADIADRQKIATATHFNVHLRTGPADKVNREAPNLIDAVKIADEMGKTASGKAPMIYAVTPEKFTVLVPKDMIAEARKDIEQIGKGLSGTEIAKLTAIITGGGYKRANSKAAAEARFIKIATEAGFANAADIVHGPYDLAEHIIREKLAGKALTIAEVKAIKPATDSIELTAADHATIADASKKVAAEMIRRREQRESVAAIMAGDADPHHPARKAAGKRAAIAEAAQRGELPAAPDFTAPTHARFRKKLAEIVALVEAGDVAGLKAIVINPVSSSPKAMAKYRDLAVIALEARQQKEAA